MLRYPPPTALNTYKLAVTSFEQKLAPTLFRVRVSSTDGSAVFLQLHPGITEPADTTVPLMAAVEIAAGEENVDIDISPEIGQLIESTGLVLVASSTRDTLTVDTGATLHMTAFVEEWDHDMYLLPTDSVAGDLTTDRATLTVWNEASGPKRLKRLQVINNNAAARYVVVYAENTPDAGSLIVTWREIAASGRLDIRFGGGISPLQNDSQTLRQACVVAIQDSLTPGDYSATDMKCRATYGAQ